MRTAKPFPAILWTATCLLAAPLAAQEPEPDDAFFDTVDVEIVNVEVFVTDSGGRPVTGLTRDDFELRVDGRPVEIVNFYAEAAGRPAPTASPDAASAPGVDAGTDLVEPPEQKLHLVVFVDNRNLNPGNRKRAFRDLRRFLDENLGPGDVVSVISLADSLWIHNDFTADRRAIERVLDEVETVQARDFGADADRRRVFDSIARLRSTNMNAVDRDINRAPLISEIRAYAENRYLTAKSSIETLENVLKTLAGIPGRKAMIHLSDGIATRPGEDLYELWHAVYGNDNATYERDVGPYDLLREFRRLGRIANAHRVTLYALDAENDHRALGRSASMAGAEGGIISTHVLELMDANHREPLELAARTTGGRRIQRTTELASQLADLALDFGSFYSLGFRPAPGDGEAEERTIEVNVQRKGLQVRHRETYRPKRPDDRSSEAVLSALLYGTTTNPLGVVLEPGDRRPREDGGAIVPIAVRIPVARLAVLPRDGVRAADLTFFVSVQDPAGDPRPVQKIPFQLRIPEEHWERARTDAAAYELPLVVRPGDQRVAIAVRDDLAGIESTVRLDL